jgi:hypothetical protein
MHAEEEENKYQANTRLRDICKIIWLLRLRLCIDIVRQMYIYASYVFRR